MIEMVIISRGPTSFNSRTNSILENIYLAFTPDFEIKVNVFENQLSYKHSLDVVHV